MAGAGGLGMVGLAMAPAAAAHATPGPGPNQWWFDSWGIQQDVWPITKGKGVTVAVLDTGVNARLPDMGPAVVPGGDVTGKGGDGREDFDTHDNGHGTGMASLIASQGTKTGFVGIAPEAKILPVTSPAVTGPTTAKAIRFAVDHGAKVVNMSQSSLGANLYPNQCPPELLEAVKYAADNNVVLVASAGNTGDVDNKPNYPGSCPGVLAVGALAQNGKPWASTQRQNYVTVGAPGAGVGWINKEGHAYDAGEGTSQASALAAGAVALVRSRYPQMPARQVVQRITNTAKDFGTPGRDDQLGYGVISIPRALKQKVGANAPNPVYERLDKAAAKSPGGSGATAPKAKDNDDSSGSGMLLLVGGIVVVAVLAVGGFLLLRKRGSQTPGPQPTGPQPGMP
ncbi:S8 family serine peptidase, partial [Actinomadura rubrisoli]|uniref:S8 family serine peptidase n=1 Tax=Actinomadura rubrisoli TaxID=2530368 RepID=UPI00140455E3